ncbi:MAG: alpha/beta hydrolase [Armatimonadota bacterium]|nr:alpha/beta hydrolase [bacterium]
MPIAHVNGTKIYYETVGEGRALVMVHGLGATHAMMRPQVEYFGQSHMVICPDLRGNGRSGRLDMPAGEVLWVQCQDIASALDQLGVLPVDLLGVSYGGVFAQLFTHLYPDNVRSLIIVDSFCDTRPTTLKRSLLKAITSLAWVYHLPASLLVMWAQSAYERWPLAREEVSRIVREVRPSEAMLQRAAISHVNFTGFLPGIRVPTLGVVGDYTDIGVEYMRQVTDLIPNSRLEILHDSFDPSNLCQPEQFNHILDEFLK